MIYPAPQMERYRLVSSKASAGAFMSPARNPDSSGTRTVSITPAAKKSRMLVPTIRPRASLSPSPSFCPSIMVVPMEKELTRPVMIIMS